MTWDTARAALDVCLARRALDFSVEFNGGEPLLEPDLLRRCIEYVEARRGESAVRFFLTTNGTLITHEMLEFLVAHDVGLQISLDGVPKAQGHRGDWTSERLDHVLEELARSHPGYTRRRLRIQAGLMPSTLHTMADSGRYFLDSEVPEVLFYTVLGQDDAWTLEDEEALEFQVGRLLEDGINHWNRTAEVPIMFLREVEERVQGGPGEGPFCGAGSGSGFFVDTSGRAWTCLMFASSLQPLSPLAREAEPALDLGEVREPALKDRLAGVPSLVSRLRLFTHRRNKHSSFSRCRDCEFLPACSLCPAAISHTPGNRDPDKVPDFFCAFTRATGKARREFRRRTADSETARRLEKARAALERLKDVVQDSLNN